jgi:hypothetical protein
MRNEEIEGKEEKDRLETDTGKGERQNRRHIRKGNGGRGEGVITSAIALFAESMCVSPAY